MTLSVRPSFWLTALLLGSLYGGSDPAAIALWVGVVLVSVLVHELGHAGAALWFGGAPHIELHGMGGTTSTKVPQPSTARDVLVTLAGPAAGALLAAALYAAALQARSRLLLGAVELNLFWTLVNLLPIQPLDGGHVLRSLLQHRWGLPGLRVAHWVGLAVAAGAAGLSWLADMTLTAFSLALLAAANFRGAQEVAELEAVPEAEAEEFEEARKQPRARAARRLYRLYRSTRSRRVRVAAAAALAERLNPRPAFRLLDRLGDDLPPELLPDLQRLAYEAGEPKKALKAGSDAFLSQPDPEIAFFNAAACAAMKDAVGAARWLKTGFRHGLPKSVLDDPALEPVRGDPMIEDLRR